MKAAAAESRYELDFLNPVHFPAPPIPDWFARELRELLPLNPYGEPQLIAEWGMDARCFRNGDPRSVKYIAFHEVIKTTKWRRLDIIEGCYEYFDTRDAAVKALNIRLAPQLEYKTTREVRIWGPPRWHIAQWFPPEKIDTPANWERNRIARYTNRKREQVVIDALGPYPSRGQYRECMVVQGPEGEFRDLDRGLMTELRRMIHERELYSYNDHSDAQEIRNLTADLQAEAAKEEQLIEDEFMDEVGASAYRLIEGNVRSGSGGTVAQAARRLKQPTPTGAP